ncbi:hypothetical protein AA958_28960 [Streptomyces sp. CNQ-509]|nr:hypothetical protein AA958_28960 [Streptomyces sp. CNQ-509]
MAVAAARWLPPRGSHRFEPSQSAYACIRQYQLESEARCNGFFPVRWVSARTTLWSKSVLYAQMVRPLVTCLTFGRIFSHGRAPATCSSVMPCTQYAPGVIEASGLTSVSSSVLPVAASMTAISTVCPSRSVVSVSRITAAPGCSRARASRVMPPHHGHRVISPAYGAVSGPAASSACTWARVGVASSWRSQSSSQPPEYGAVPGPHRDAVPVGQGLREALDAFGAGGGERGVLPQRRAGALAQTPYGLPVDAGHLPHRADVGEPEQRHRDGTPAGGTHGHLVGGGGLDPASRLDVLPVGRVADLQHVGGRGRGDVLLAVRLGRPAGRRPR